MGLFDSFFGKKEPEKEESLVTPEDRKWVESCFRWLEKNFGKPILTVFSFNAEYFPETFKIKLATVDYLINDLCRLLKIPRNIVSYENIPDVRDISQTPNEINGKVFESDVELNLLNPEKPKYNIHLATNLADDGILVRRLIIELVRIKLNEVKKDSLYNPNDIYIAYIAAVYFGFGILISQMSSERKIDYTAGWQRTSTLKTEVSFQVIAFALAGYSKLIGADVSSWKAELPIYVWNEVELSLRLLENTPLDMVSREKPVEKLTDYDRHWKLARGFYDEKKFREAIEEYKLAIECTSNSKRLSVLNNNIGYSYLLLKEYQLSIPYFENSLTIDKNYAFANNNLGFAYLMLDQPDKAKDYFDKEELTGNLAKAYYLRNMAIYCMSKNDMKTAGEYFMKAFEINIAIDLVEFFYAKYLFAISEDDEAMQYLTISVNKEEKEGVELMKALRN